ncbi:MAG: acyl-CoA dehydrogenase family protein [Acidimicrobiaceae bacterium]|nr:acyl-CoA dehydrogenase family protein [Acidimicrobiaceae bacterium]
MDFKIPKDIQEFLDRVDDFIEKEIKPLEEEKDNIRFFDHRREDARTDWERGGLPNHEWEALLGEARRRADAAGIYRYSWPKEHGGQEGSNLGMAIIREHLARKGLGLHCDLQNEHTIVGNSLGLQLMSKYGTDEQKAQWLPKMAAMRGGFAFGITELNHGTDATYMETNAYRDGDEWVINGNKTFNTGLHAATHDLIFARTSGEAGQPRGISAFITPTDAPGFKVEEFLWTFNMPTDHATVSLTNVRVHKSTMFGEEGEALSVMQSFVNENRIRQAASSLGAAQFCIDESVRYARERRPFGKALAANQAIQFPLVELQTQCEMLRCLIHKTAWEIDEYGEFAASDKVSMCNYWSNRLCCQAADRAMQVHGGLGYSRHKPFEHIYRHHRRYRITEGTEELQMRRVAGYLFGFMDRPKGVSEEAVTAKK